MTTDRLGLGLGPDRPTLRAIVPFIALMVVSLAVIAAPARLWREPESILALGVFALAVLVQIVAMRRDRRTWLEPVGSWVYFLGVLLLLIASDGSNIGLGVLVMLPLIWLAMYGTRPDLVVGVLLTLTALGLPLWIADPSVITFADVRVAVLLMALAVVVAPLVHSVVRTIRGSEQRARELTQQLGGIMDGASLTALISTDARGVITSFSRGAELMLGYTSDEIIGRSSALLHDADEVAAVAAELGVVTGLPVAQLLADRRAPARTWTYWTRTGARIFVRLVVTRLTADDGTTTGYLAVATDCTDEVRARRALDESEARWRVVMDHLPDATVIVVDEELQVQLTAGAGAMRQGLGDATGQNLTQFMKSENIAVIGPLVGQALRGAEGRAELSATRTGHEHDIWVSPLPSTLGSGSEAVILARDISEQRTRERELTRARDGAERLFVDAPQGIVVLSSEGVVTVVNPAFAAMIGRDATTLVGSDLRQLGSPEDKALSKHLKDLTSNHSGRSKAEWRIVAPDTAIIEVALSSTLLPGRDGEPDQILMNVTNISDRHRLEEQMVHLSEHDPLTGLVNRKRFAVELSSHLEFCRRYGFRGALLLIDLDHFKEVNDTLGHNTGDELIVSLSGVLRGTVRGTDTVCRLGGDEFGVLLQETDRAGAELVAESIVTRVRQFAQSHDGIHRNITASVGLVMIDERTASADDLLSAADMTMYDAKDAGRDQWAVLDYELFDSPRTGARMAWNSRIERALENDDFELHLQPIWDMKLEKVTGAEALLRLADGPELVYPSRFLYVAEHTGLITKVDEWVLNRSVEILKRLQGLEPSFHLEVNVSGKSIGGSSLEKTLISALNHHDVDPTGLVLEITETAAVADIAAARAFAQRVTAIGCRFALDDFGAGFGSFYYLKHLLFDYVKIDGEFVSTCHLSPTDRAIVHAIVGIAHGLGKRTIAEFVCDPAILDVIRAEGVDFAQGYQIGKGIPEAEFIETFLRPTS